jgi:hypothetical protein
MRDCNGPAKPFSKKKNAKLKNTARLPGCFSLQNKKRAAVPNTELAAESKWP